MSRIYKIKIADETRLILASNKTQAMYKVANEVMKISLATQQEIFDFTTAGIKIEKVGDPTRELWIEEPEAKA
jgi:hypothetical protein